MRDRGDWRSRQWLTARSPLENVLISANDAGILRTCVMPSRHCPGIPAHLTQVRWRFRQRARRFLGNWIAAMTALIGDATDFARAAGSGARDGGAVAFPPRRLQQRGHHRNRLVDAPAPPFAGAVDSSDGGRQVRGRQCRLEADEVIGVGRVAHHLELDRLGDRDQPPGAAGPTAGGRSRTRGSRRVPSFPSWTRFHASSTGTLLAAPPSTIAAMSSSSSSASRIGCMRGSLVSWCSTPGIADENDAASTMLKSRVRSSPPMTIGFTTWLPNRRAMQSVPPTALPGRLPAAST
jgi:hypothetical protein